MNTADLLRGTYGLLVAKILVLTFFMTSFYNVASFARSTQDAVGQSFLDSARVEMYSLTDHLTDPTLFEAYRDSIPNIEKVVRFYDSLEQDAPEGVQLLSAFDQAMPVANFVGGETFEHGHGTQGTVQGPYEDYILGEQVISVKSMQLSQSTFDFYNLAGQDGTGLDWDGVDYESGTIPVLLGSNYTGLYAVGDQLTVNYYSRPTQMVIVGFLPVSASMFYQGNINFFLDDYLVVPYPKSITSLSPTNQVFYGILAFAMLNANIALEQGQSESAIFRALEAAAASSGFGEYALLNVPNYLTQFASVRALVQDNFALVCTLEILVAAATAIVSFIITSSTSRRRRRRIRIAWQLGQSRSSLGRAALAIVVIEYTGLAILFLTVTHMFPNQDAGAWRLCVGSIAVFAAVEMLRRWSMLQRGMGYQSRNES